MKLLFVHKSMNMGGIEKSLLNLTNELVQDNEIDVLLLNDTFGTENFNNNVNFLESKKMLRVLNPKKSYSKINKSRLAIIKKVTTIFGVRAIMEKIFAKTKVVQGDYDVAIAFHGEDYVTCYQVANKIKASKKYVFLHFDVSRVEIKKRVYKTYKKFDKIICVSNGCAEAFKTKYPLLADKVDFLYNLCDMQEVKLKADEFAVSYPKECLNIVSVSRLSEEKGHLRSLKVFKRLHDEGYKFCWHIVGDGDQRSLVEEFIKQNGMKEYVKLYGNQQNPYPYVKNADLFYLGSFHESFGIALIEAMALNLPVLTTNTISAKEIVGEKGFVCENDEEGIACAIKTLLEDKLIIGEYKEMLKNYSFDKDEIIEKFYKL